MSNASQSLYGWRDPLPPDPVGYCYIDRDHFNTVTQRIAHRLILKHGLFVDRLPLWVMFVFLAAVIIAVALASSLLPSGSSTFTQLLCLVLLGWYLGKTRRFVKTIIRHRMCLKCGYSLRRSPTASAGYGRCSECGTPFNAAQYRRPPRGYKRPRPPSESPPWLDRLDPLDRARMERNATQSGPETDP